MAVLDDQTRKQVGEFLKGMPSEVKIVFFGTDGDSGEYSGQIAGLLDDIASAAPKVKLEKYVLEKDGAKAEEHGADRAPVIIFKGKNRGDMRFYGIPAGHEFGAFLADIMDAARGDTDEVPDDLKKAIREIKTPMTLDVFVTPTCPHCPGAVRLAHAMSILNPNIRSNGVEAMEFSEWADKHGVRSVPKTSVNGGKLYFEGAYPPDMLVAKIKETLKRRQLPYDEGSIC